MNNSNPSAVASGAGADFDFSDDGTSSPGAVNSQPQSQPQLNSIISASACPVSPQILSMNSSPHHGQSKKKKLIIKGSPAFSHSIPFIDLTIPGLDDFSLDNSVVELSEPASAAARQTKRPTRSHKPPPRRKENERATIDDFFIPSMDAIRLFETANLNTNQLKQLCRYHKLNVSGVKNTLKTRVADFLKNTCLAIQLQRLYRGHVARRYISTRGPGFSNRTACVNDTDFLSLDDIASIPHYQFFSFRDVDGHVYGFDVRSAHTLFCSGKRIKKDIFNPYNRKEIPENIIKSLKTNITFSKIMKFPVEVDVKEDADTTPLTPEQQFNQELVSLLQTIDELGNYTDMAWFMGLTQHGWISLIENIFDIWIYRSQLPEETRREFFPPNGKPFVGVRIDRVRVMTLKELKETALSIIKRFVQTSPNEELRKLGALYVLGALTLVCPPAATAMPWLYESFH
jgi:hypothetical protein